MIGGMGNKALAIALSVGAWVAFAYVVDDIANRFGIFAVPLLALGILFLNVALLRQTKAVVA